MLFMRKPVAMVTAADALPGRATPIPTATTHFVNGSKLLPPYPAGLEQAVFALVLGVGRRHLYDRRRLCRRLHAKPDI